MKLFNQTLEFWVIILMAILFKLATSDRLNAMGVLATITGSVLAAVAVTPLFIEWFDIKSEPAAYGIAAFMALTGEHTLRNIILKSKSGESPGSILHWLRSDEKKEPPK